jgi:hypothetical protein
LGCRTIIIESIHRPTETEWNIISQKVDQSPAEFHTKPKSKISGTFETVQIQKSIQKSVGGRPGVDPKEEPPTKKLKIGELAHSGLKEKPTVKKLKQSAGVGATAGVTDVKKQTLQQQQLPFKAETIQIQNEPGLYQPSCPILLFSCTQKPDSFVG